MKEADYISRIDSEDPDLEFENLRNVGIDEIQRLAGSQWTDYNIHDPGITILEQLCYAITELGYKTAFDIKDLIASQNVDHGTSGTFFSAAQILEGKPITTNDYRRLLIDRVDGLRDVWIEPLNLNSDRTQIKGMYLVLIKSSPIRIKTDADRERLIEDTRSYLEKYSNLGEAFNDILILDEVEIKVSGEIDLLKEANVDRTHAQILYNIQQFISSPIRFYSLDQMLKTGLSVEDIFCGPRLMNGFIKDEDLKSKMKTLMTSHLINIINEVDGVSKVRFLKIETLKDATKETDANHLHKIDIIHDSKSEMMDGVLIDMNKVAALANMMIPYNPNAQQTLDYFQNNEKANLFKNNVIRYFRQIENENKIKYTNDYQLSNDIVIKKGIYKPIDEYFSIQEHFPAIYAVGSQGIPPDLEPEKINQVKQLKAYLLVFEQILTNYLAQLTNFSFLFSLDENLAKSYFAGPLQSVPYIRDLLVEINNTTNDSEVISQTREVSQSALNLIDDFNSRRHQALDHLLARFGEEVSNFGIEKFNYYYDEQTLKHIKLSAKINYLKELVFLSSSRARSFNTEKEYWNDSGESDSAKSIQINISYLEKKAKIRLGIPLQNIQIADYLKKHVRTSNTESNFSVASLKELLSKTSRLDNNQLVLSTVADPLLKKENFEPGIEIDDELLRRGIWAENYKVVSDTENESVNMVAFSKKIDRHSIPVEVQQEISKKLSELSEDLDPKPEYLRFLIEEKNKKPVLVEFEREDINKYNPIPRNIWVLIKEFGAKNEAESFVHSMTNYLAYLNINMEGFYLIDHIELRPRNKSDLYGIILKDRAGRTGLISENQYSYFEVQEALINLFLQAKKAKFIHENEAGDHLDTKLVYDEKIIGTYLNLNPTQFLDNEGREKELKALFNSLSEFDLHDPTVIQFYSAKDINKEIGEATFFSFRLSIIIPSWPSRFADPEFRKVLESMIRDDAPAHIGIDFYYLDYEKLSQFESLYVQWLEDLKILSIENINKLNESSKSLSLLLKSLAKELN